MKYKAEVHHYSPWFDHVVYEKEFNSMIAAIVWAKTTAMIDDYLITPCFGGWEEIGIYWRVYRR